MEWSGVSLGNSSIRNTSTRFGTRPNGPLSYGLLNQRTLALDRQWVVLVFGLFLGLGSFPLWALVLLSADGLDLGTRHVLGALVGKLAFHSQSLRLGSPPAGGCFRGRLRINFPQQQSQRRL